MNQSEIEANTTKFNWHQVQQNACEQVTIGFGLTSDWLSKWRKLFYPIREQSKTKSKQRQHYFRQSFENCSKISTLTASQRKMFTSLILLLVVVIYIVGRASNFSGYFKAR